MGISFRVATGFSILVVLLLIGGGLSLFEARCAGAEMRASLGQRHALVESGHALRLALEHQRRAVLLAAVASHAPGYDGCAEFRAAATAFEQCLAQVSAGLTADGDVARADSLSARHRRYRSMVERLLAGGEYGIPYLRDSVMPLELTLVEPVECLLSDWQAALRGAASQLEEVPQRMLRSGLIVAAVTVLYTLMFSYFVHHFYVVPLRRVGASIQHYLRFRRYTPVPHAANDELADLRDAVDRLVTLSQEHRAAGEMRPVQP